IVIQIDRRTGLITDRTDHRTALTDHVTDLVRMDLDRGNARRTVRQLGPRLGNHLVHLAKDVQACFVRLLQSQLHDLVSDTVDLDIHLQCGDTVFGTGYLEIHVAQLIFVTQNVGQNRELVAFLDQTHGDTGNRCLDRYASVHLRNAGSIYGSDGARTVLLG